MKNRNTQAKDFRAWWPYENQLYRTALDQEEIEKRLRAIIEESPTFWEPMYRDKAYKGYVAKKSFSLKRIIRYRNSFLPILTGHIESQQSGCTIRVKMRLSLYVQIFMTLWSSILFVGIYVLAKRSIQSGFQGMILVPLVMLGLGYFICTYPFKKESRVYREFLEKELELERVD